MPTDSMIYDRAHAPDLPHLARLLSHAFAGTPEGCAEWATNAGLENIRVLRPAPERGGKAAAPPAASLVRIPMGQHFGGRAVPMIGIAGVAVAPELRGRGRALAIMQHAMREIAAEGVPLSCLYASTQTLYRQVGFEQAGCRFQYNVPLARLGITERAGAVVPLEQRHEPAVDRCYRAFASRFNGPLERGAYCWRRVRENRGEVFCGFGIAGPSAAIDGYVYLHQRRKPESGRHDVIVSDIAFATPGAGRRLLGFLADFATVGDDAVLFGGPVHPLMLLLPQQAFTVQKRDYWMLRVTDARAALRARGYARATAAAVTIELDDELIPANAGRHSVRIARGRASVSGAGAKAVAGAKARAGSTGDGVLRLDPRALAALYSGYVTPAQAELGGLLRGSDRALAAAESVFAGSMPWMSDMF